MKRFLVVYYSQSGQLVEIVHSVLRSFVEYDRVELVFEAIRPEKAYPFPWSALEFADVFPESLEEIPCRLEPFRFDPEAHYDGVILAYQVWYLSPSIPISAFLQSAEAARVMRNRPVVTLVGCRNMWLLAHEKVKSRIVRNGGKPAGNIALMDRAPNLLGVVSIAAWMLTGSKRRFLNLFPRPGIAGEDIRDSARFGEVLLNGLTADSVGDLQPALNRLGAATVVPSYILFEQRISKIFAAWSRFIRRKGGPGDPARKGRLRWFIAYLLTAVFLLAPLATAITFVVQKLRKNQLEAQVLHFADNRIPQSCGTKPPSEA
ncbi:MAG: hypothetical protein ACOWWM_02580 [Desulfobacterales bacterium]